MRWVNLIGIAVVGFIVTDQFYTAPNARMMAVAGIIMFMVWPEFKRLLMRQYVRLVRAVRFLFTPSKYYDK
ncbi:hypothetical protein SCACP_28750 [Sporomusa carbonis]|uniref:hypothetical protein n=1 Tax=Sporomusa carbonis TaxID=3076075 RepID=UPI003A690119